VSAVIGNIFSPPADYILSDANNLTVPLLPIFNSFNFREENLCSGRYWKQHSIKL